MVPFYYNQHIIKEFFIKIYRTMDVWTNISCVCIGYIREITFNDFLNEHET